MSISADEIYQAVTNRMLDALAQGTVPWQKPWVGEHNAPRNLQSGKPYRGINSLLLGFTDYSDPRWTTFAAAKKMGGKVRAGEKSQLVTLWKRIKVKDASAASGEKVIAILRYFRVFNVEQVDFPEGVVKPLKPAEVVEGWDGHVEAEKVIADFLASDNAPSLSYGGERAYYEPSRHRIKLPVAGDFRKAAGFYSTAFHECAHSTGHRSMLAREFGTSFGSVGYAKEELVAEMAAAFVCATIGLDEQFNNSAAYIEHWQKQIADDPKLVVQAAAKAQKAADRIMGTVYEYTEPASKINPDEVAAPVAA